MEMGRETCLQGFEEEEGKALFKVIARVLGEIIEDESDRVG